MTVDDSIKCSGMDTIDKALTWDGNYPHFEPTKKGYVVHLNKHTDLPGLFTNEYRARIAYKRYQGKIIEVDAKIAAKKAAKE